PALLKGLFDRAWLPRFAFNFTSMMGFIPYWKAHLTGKSARLIILSNTHPWATWLLFGEFTNELSRAILKFAGIRPVRVSIFSPSEKISPARAEKWIAKATALGKAGK